ncbi:MAG: stage II sporulation protein M [Candidatus Methanoperedens sp.]|nr:MAG: stage II sporulation protein M [Candidatus Methanoperedens sp.]
MRKDLDYIYSSRKYFLASAGIFIFSFVIGLLISAKNPEASENLLGLLKETFGSITSLEPFGRMLEIFKNNVRNSFMALLFGLGFGIVPFVFVAINGIVLGILVEFFLKKQGTFFVIAAILPHGIIELPMVIMSVGIGFRLGHVAYLSTRHQKTTHELLNELKQGVIFYFKIVVPLLLLAALVESYITPLFIYRLYL